jgi:hypothetical protein
MITAVLGFADDRQFARIHRRMILWLIAEPTIKR